MTKLESNIPHHIATSRSKDEYYTKVMEDVERIGNNLKTQKGAEMLIKDIVFAWKVGSILDYSRFNPVQKTLPSGSARD